MGCGCREVALAAGRRCAGPRHQQVCPTSALPSRHRKPPLNPRPIDPSPWPPFHILVSPRSPYARGKMHLSTRRSVRSSSPDRPLLTSPRVLCTHARSLRWHGALRLSLWRGALRHAASLKAYLCQSCSRAAPARAAVRCRLALSQEVPAVCGVAVWAIARAVSEPPFWLPFEPEALSRCIWRVGGDV